MPTITPLRDSTYYHIYTRGNNRIDLFREQRNYGYFLDLYRHHVDPVADTFAYCLLRNHFHLLIRTHDKTAKAPSQAFANLHNAYARAFNQFYGRVDALFQHPFRRIEVRSEAHLLRLVVYIHRNPQRHGLIPDFRRWQYSSYQSLVSTAPSRLQRAVVLEWFAGRATFISAHTDDMDDASDIDDVDR